MQHKEFVFGPCAFLALIRQFTSNCSLIYPCVLENHSNMPIKNSILFHTVTYFKESKKSLSGPFKNMLC